MNGDVSVEPSNEDIEVAEFETNEADTDDDPSCADSNAVEAVPPPQVPVVAVPAQYVGVPEHPSLPRNVNHPPNNNFDLFDVDSDDSDEDEEEDDNGNLPELGVRAAVDRTQFTRDEQCQLELMDVLDSAGSPRYLYDKIIKTIRKHTKKGFDYRRAKYRENIMQVIRNKMSIPEPVTVTVSETNIIKFSFMEMMEDLLAGSVFADTANLCVSPSPEEIYRPYVPQEDDILHELMSTSWYKGTCEDIVKDPEKDFVIPLILYSDRTGTDALQRYSLEPWLFTTALLKRSAREKASTWRHLGFVPKIHGNSDGAEGCRMYHEFMDEILVDLKAAQKDPPVMTLNIGGRTVERRCHFPIVMITGDQLSQDKICCRVTNNAGGASRCHRSCMCSYLDASNPEAMCEMVDHKILESLSKMVMDSKEPGYLERMVDEMTDVNSSYSDGLEEEKARCQKYISTQTKIAKILLSKPFQTHPCNNSFSELYFGRDRNVYQATTDDVMHANEAGTFKETADSVYDPLTKGEKAKLEKRMIYLLKGLRCSEWSSFPRWRISPGFTNQTNMTCDERVGSLLQLSLCLHDEEVYSILDTAHKRQRNTKYNTFKKIREESKSAQGSKAELRRKKIAAAELQEVPKTYYPDMFELHFKKLICDFTLEEIRQILTVVSRHGFDISFVHCLDKLQLAQMLTELAAMKVHETRYPDAYPSGKTQSVYVDKGRKHRPPETLVKRIFKILNSAIPSKEDGPYLGGKGVVKKHRRKKPRLGDTKTAAVLVPMNEFQRYSEYALMYHAWAHYSHTLPTADREDLKVVDFGSRTLLRYFDFTVYRGDNTVDTNTCKSHTLVRNKGNSQCFGSLMNGSCHLGERLLKSHAKGVSRTAQRRGEEVFTYQTAQRAMEQLLFVRAWEQIHEYQAGNQGETDNPDNLDGTVSHRRMPCFEFSRDSEVVTAITSRGKRSNTNQRSGMFPPTLRRALLDLEPESNHFSIWNEITLRDDSLRVRAHPNYSQGGPWYDWVRCKFKEGNGSAMYPARVLCFYKTEKDLKMRAVVHSVAKKMATRKESKVLGDTNLCTHYRMHYRGRKPGLIDVSVDAIDRVILGLPSYKGLVPPDKRSGTDDNQHTVMVLLPRSVWARGFLEMTRTLMKKRGRSGPYRGRKHQSLLEVNVGHHLLSQIE